jgi:hypothetical protein
VSTQSLQIVPKESEAGEPSAGWSPRAVLLVQWVAATILVFVLGTWLVWLSVYLQRHFAAEDIRLACKRVMPETVDRCFDTVIIQRGGARR